MANKIEMSSKETELYNEMKKLSKRANQRILRLERLTKEKTPFAVKELQDKLSSEMLNAWTKTGRVSVKKGLSKIQMQAEIKALRQFLSENTISTEKQVKDYVKKASEKAGKKLSYKQAQKVYRSKKDYKWIYDYITPSDFWAIGNPVKEEKVTEEEFIEQLQTHSELIPDEELRKDLHDLYLYVKEGV